MRRRRSRVRVLVHALAALALLGLPAGPPWAAGGEARIRVVDGLVSARFDSVPIADAVDAIRRAADLEVRLPASVEGKTVTLAVEHLPLERFIRRVLDLLDVGGYALVYEAGGQTRRLIVVESARAVAPEAAPAHPADGSSAEPAPGPGRPVVRTAPPLGAPPVHALPLVRVEPRGLSIQPRGQYERLDLTVSQQEGAAIRREYPTGAPAYFELVDAQGKSLRDGSYSYELVVVPAIPPQVREQMDAVRESPDDRIRLERELREQGWLPREPLVLSGHFSVTGGLIVDGSQAEGAPRRR